MMTLTLLMHGDLSTRRVCDVVVVNTIGKAKYIYMYIYSHLGIRACYYSMYSYSYDINHT